jgi:toxin ParE1/3/4
MTVRIQEAASLWLDDIYRYTRDRWGEVQADHDITVVFEAFEMIEKHGPSLKPVLAEFDMDGYYFRYEKHFGYCRWLSNCDIGVVTIRHERMHQIDRFRDDFLG